SLACLIQSRLVQATAPRGGKVSKQEINRGVKEALFHVLLGADMPSVLVEAGFITHVADRNRVLSPEGQKTMGRAIAQAIVAFQEQKNSSKSSLTLTSCKVN